MKEIRCWNCNALLAKAAESFCIEIKCRRCRALNRLEVVKSPIGTITVNERSITNGGSNERRRSKNQNRTSNTLLR